MPKIKSLAKGESNHYKMTTVEMSLYNQSAKDGESNKLTSAAFPVLG
jgi:hypothetical protein